jgi:hypothetical protein
VHLPQNSMTNQRLALFARYFGILATLWLLALVFGIASAVIVGGVETVTRLPLSTVVARVLPGIAFAQMVLTPAVVLLSDQFVVRVMDRRITKVPGR